MTVEVALTRGKVALIDEADWPVVAPHSWHACRRRGTSWVAATMIHNGERWRGALMHRLLMRAPVGMCVDHINGDPLDNRRENLRLATARQNSWNARPKGDGPFAGVQRSRTGWKAKIYPNGRYVGLGFWETEALAAAAYNVGAKHFFGEFARLNDVPPLPAELWKRVLTEKRDEIARLETDLRILPETP